MTARIEDIEAKRLVGIRLVMSYANNRTRELWQNFMPNRREIGSTISPDLFSLQNYPPGSGPMSGQLDTPFEKWAAMEVGQFSIVPPGMESMVLPAGKYAVFMHHGPASEFMKTFHFIFNVWLPGSEFEVDDRPHFERLSENYRPDDPNAMEEVWIPIKTKT